MFIRTVKKKNKNSAKVFEYHYLVDSIRTDKGPRQRFLLNLGKLDLPQEEWPLLAKRIDEVARGQEHLFAGDSGIERLAHEYAQKLLRKYEAEYADQSQPTFEYVDLDSLTQLQSRTIGAEYVGLSAIKQLNLDTLLRECRFTQRQIEVALLLILGRLISPGSERWTHKWARHISALDELLESDFTHLSLNTLYYTCDKLIAHQETIENHLRHKENSLFGLDEKIILYDLTNTFLEGQAALNSKAKFGRSKERRNDCRLLTLGLVIDGQGFPKCSRVFAGNQSEPKTLKQMLDTLRSQSPVAGGSSEKITVVLDAGIATEKNLEEIRDDYDYICVSRHKPTPPPSDDDLIIIKDDKHNKVEAQKITHDGETYLYCKSQLKAQKEGAMQSRFEQFFEEGLKEIDSALHKKGGTKKYDKVNERIGRLREKYKRISRFYSITVEQKDGIATRIRWRYIKEQSDQRFSGSYYLRTSKKQMREKQLWSIYTMLTEVEEAFRSLKSELDLRPVYHQKESRSDAHIFITVLAYHLLHTIGTRLKAMGISERWDRIRQLLSTHVRSRFQLTTREETRIHVVKCSDPEYYHKVIYDALKLSYQPCEAKRIKIR